MSDCISSRGPVGGGAVLSSRVGGGDRPVVWSDLGMSSDSGIGSLSLAGDGGFAWAMDRRHCRDPDWILGQKTPAPKVKAGNKRGLITQSFSSSP
jgi:hypothetical protein